MSNGASGTVSTSVGGVTIRYSKIYEGQELFTPGPATVSAQTESGGG
jgi:hypothetical protein